MRITKEQIDALAAAIVNSNAHRQGFIAAVLNADGERVGYVHYMHGLAKAHRNAVGLVSDVANGADLHSHFLHILGSDMPDGGKIEIIKRRKKTSK